MFDCKLPSGINVSIKAPSYRDRMEAVKEFRAAKDDAGYTVEELMAAKSISAIDGNVVDHNLYYDPVLLMSEWANQDVQYFIEFFMTAFFLDDKLRERAANEAKKLMIGQPSMKTRSSK